MLQKTMVTGWGLKACSAPATLPSPYVSAPGASKYPATTCDNNYYNNSNSNPART